MPAQKRPRRRPKSCGPGSKRRQWISMEKRFRSRSASVSRPQVCTPLKRRRYTALSAEPTGRCTGRKTAAGTASASSGKTTCELPPVRRGKTEGPGPADRPRAFLPFLQPVRMSPAVPWMAGPGPFTLGCRPSPGPSGNGSALRPFRRP